MPGTSWSRSGSRHEGAETPAGRLGGLLRRCALVGWVAIVLALTAPPCAIAEPASGGALVDAPTLSWRDLGMPETLSFYGETNDIEVSIPVPTGLVPAAINATVDLPFPTRWGVVTVMQDNRLISRVGLPLTDLAPLVIPLPGLQVVGDSVSLIVTLSALAEDRFCLDELTPVDLINGSVAFSGRESSPATVADFLPAIMRKVTIAIPTRPSRAESDAAVQLATSMVNRYRSQTPEVLVIPLAEGASVIDAPSLPLERQFVVKEGPYEGLTMQGSQGVPQLLISGSADQLANQVRLLTDRSIGLAVGRRAVAVNLNLNQPTPGNTATMAQLGQRTVTARSVTIGLDQTRFGRSVQGYRVHVIGSYTPLSNTFGGQIAISINGETIDTWPADANGVIDRWVSVPDRLVQRYTSFVVSVNTTGHIGGCNDYSPAKLTINGNTLVETTPALPPIPAGFGSLPQALMPTMNVGIAADSFADTARAIQLAAGLQRLSITPLRTTVTSVEQALKAPEPAIVISADGWADQSIALPVRADGSDITVEGLDGSDSAATLTLDPAVPFGSLQSVFDGNRSLLIATSNGAPGELDGLLRWLNSDDERWSQLKGNALVAFPGRVPESVLDRMPPTVYGPVPSESDLAASKGRKGSAKWWVAAGVLAATGAAAATLAIRARRARFQPNQAQADPVDPRSDEGES